MPCMVIEHYGYCVFHPCVYYHHAEDYNTDQPIPRFLSDAEAEKSGWKHDFWDGLGGVWICQEHNKGR